MLRSYAWIRRNPARKDPGKDAADVMIGSGNPGNRALRTLGRINEPREIKRNQLEIDHPRIEATISKQSRPDRHDKMSPTNLRSSGKAILNAGKNLGLIENSQATYQQNRNKSRMIFPEWEDVKKIMVILAHPDDPEFFLGGTIADWVKQGHTVSYLLLTKGQRGVSPDYPDPEKLGPVRVKEQQNAAAKLGVQNVDYLDYQDGYLIPDIEARKKVAREIRRTQPDVVATFDPLMIYQRGRINHPDHRAAGQIVIDAIFPAVENPAFFPELLDEGLLQHKVKELWLCLPAEANIEMDETHHWQSRIDALLQHVSQIGEPKAFLAQMEEKRQARFGEEMRYVESFRRLIL